MKTGVIQVPWTEDHVRGLLNYMADKEFSPKKIQRYWCTLNWLGGQLGLLKPSETERLREKKKAVRSEAVVVIHAPQKRAKVPSKLLLIKLEEGAYCLVDPDAMKQSKPPGQTLQQWPWQGSWQGRARACRMDSAAPPAPTRSRRPPGN